VCPTFTYGELNIKDVAKNFQEIDINAKFSSVKINIGKGSSFKVDAANYKYGYCKVSGFNSVENNIHYEGGYVSTGNSKDEVKLNVNGGNGGSIKFDGGSFSSLSVKGK
jgi:predicted ribonuclease toxin of YeeF-YezG toxin-antitoxin module